MLRVLLLYCLCYQAQGKPIQLKGKVDIATELASVFQELISQYLNDNTNYINTDIDINKLVESFKNFLNKPTKEVSNLDSSNENTNEHRNVKTVKINMDEDKKNVYTNFKKSNVDSDYLRASKHVYSHKSRKEHRDYRYSTKTITDDTEYETEKKRKTKIKGVSKKHRGEKEITDTGSEYKRIKEDVSDTGREHNGKNEGIKNTGKEHKGRTEENRNTERELKGKEKEIRDTGREYIGKKEENRGNKREHTEKIEEIRDTGREYKGIKEIRGTGKGYTGENEEIRDTERDYKEIIETERENKEKRGKISDTGREYKEKKEIIRHTERETQEDKEENRNTGRENDGKWNENKDKKITREKTVLEEILGTDEGLHVYGNHRPDDTHGLPLNNIKV